MGCQDYINNAGNTCEDFNAELYWKACNENNRTVYIQRNQSNVRFNEINITQVKETLVAGECQEFSENRILNTCQNNCFQINVKGSEYRYIDGSVHPSRNRSCNSSFFHTLEPFVEEPSATPSLSFFPSVSSNPSTSPSMLPYIFPSSQPSVKPSGNPSILPSMVPSDHPSETPSSGPSDEPSMLPSMNPSDQPSQWNDLIPIRRNILVKSNETDWNSVLAGTYSRFENSTNTDEEIIEILITEWWKDETTTVISQKGLNITTVELVTSVDFTNAEVTEGKYYLECEWR